MNYKKWIIVFFLIILPFISKLLLIPDPEIQHFYQGWNCTPSNFQKDINTENQNWKLIKFPTNWLMGGWKEKAILCQKTIYLTNEEAKVTYGLFLANIVNAYEIFWNSEKISSRGKWTEDGHIIEPDPRPYLHFIPRKFLNVGENTLTLRIFDSSYAGGVYNVPLFGKKDPMFRETFLWFIKNGGYSLFFLFMGMYHFIQYSQSKHEKYFLYFAILCICNGINVLAYYKIIYWFYSSFYFNYFIFHFCFLITVILIPFFLSNLFEYKLDWYSKFLIAFYLLDLGLFLGTFLHEESREFFRSYIFSFTFTLMNALLSIELFRTIFKVQKSNIHGSHFYIIGSFVGGAVILQSFLRFFSEEVTEIYLLEGFMSFILSIALAISAKSRGALEDLAKIKADYSIELEKQVDQKTQELGHLNHELSKSNSLKDKLFSILAHDLRTPMQSLQDLLEISVEKNLSAHRFKTEIKKVSLSLFNNKFLLENLLHWISMQMKTEELILSEVDIYTILREMQIFYQPQTIVKKIEIQILLSNPMICLADVNILRLVLRNLLSNAIKFSENGGKIQIGAIQKGENCEIFILDFGIGFNTQNMEGIIEGNPGKSSRGTNNEVGLGLGLHLSQEFLKKMNSKIFFNSQKGIGTKFYFQIPLKIE